MNHKHHLGHGGFCICPKCGHKIPHRAGHPCRENKCPECGSVMLREGGYHHQLILKKKSSN